MEKLHLLLVAELVLMLMINVQADNEIVITPGTQQWFPIGQDATLRCTWSYDGELAAENITKDAITWKTSDSSIIKLQRDGENNFIYGNSPIDASRIGNITTFGDLENDARLIIKNFTISDTMVYSCEVTALRYSRSASVPANAYAIPYVYMSDVQTTVDIREPVASTMPESANATTTPTTTEAEKDNDIIVSCTAERGYPQPSRFEFFIVDTEQILETIEGDDTRIEATADDEGYFTSTVQLRLAPNKDYNGKQISCEVFHTASDTKSQANEPSSVIQILHETSVVDIQLEPSTVNEGGSVKITCIADGNPPPNFEVRPEYSTAETTNEFWLTNVQRNQVEIEYYCVAIIGGGETEREVESAKTQLTVNYLDNIVLDKTSVEMNKGDATTVDCSAQGYPAPTIRWMKDGSFYSGNPLEINNAEYSDSGTYTCEARSQADGIEDKMQSIEVTVQGECTADFPKPTIMSSQTQSFQYSLKLECTVTGYPDCDVSFKAQDNLLSHGNLSKTSTNDGTRYVLSYNALEKFSEPVSFFCIAKNGVGSKQNKTQKIDETSDLCCEEVATGGLSTGAIIGIILLVLVILVGIPVACYFVKKRNTQPKKKAPADTEAPEPEKEGLNKDASSERSPEEP